MKLLLFCCAVFALVSSGALAQIGKSVEDCESILGRPIKVHSNVSPPARLYLHEGLHVQLSFDTGKAIAAIYRIPSPSGNQAIPSQKVKEVYALNGFSDDDLVDLDAGFPAELKGLYKLTKDKRLLVLNDATENVIVMHKTEKFLERLKNGP
jgi:hypothetical protein